MAALISKLSLFSILVLSITMALATEPEPAPIGDTIGGEDCKDSLVSISPCLPYISAPPNNLLSVAPPECCDAFSSILNHGNVFCLCYFQENPQFFGFPIDTSKLLSLSSVCLPPNVTSTENAASKELNCSALNALPPLGSAGHGLLYSPVAGPIAFSPTITSLPESSPSSTVIPPAESDNPPESDTELRDMFDNANTQTSSARKLRTTFSGLKCLFGESSQG